MLTKYKDKYDKIYSCFTKTLGNGVLRILNDDVNTAIYIPNKTERNYHMELRRTIINDGGQLLTGTIIENYKGRYKINNFIKR